MCESVGRNVKKEAGYYMRYTQNFTEENAWRSVYSYHILKMIHFQDIRFLTLFMCTNRAFIQDS